MIRTQIQLTEEQARRLKAAARQFRVSFAEMVRRCVEGALASKSPSLAKRYERASRLVGRVHDRRGVRNLSADHDRYLPEAYD